MCDVRRRGHVSDNVRCKMHQMRVQVKGAHKETQVPFKHMLN